MFLIFSASCQKSSEKPLRSAEKKEYNEKNGCVKLLQFLNPDPLRADGISDLQQLQKLKSWSQQTMAVLRKRVQPCLSIETAPLSTDLKKALQRKKFPGPSHTESYSWPPIARGYDVVVISHCGNDPLLYLPPMLTILQTGGCYKSLPSRNGVAADPIDERQLVLRLAPGWARKECPGLPLVALLFSPCLQGQPAFRCDVIVATPHSLLRLLQYQSLLFLRLCHLVLDEVEVLLSEANEQMFAILDNFKKNIEVEERESAPHQIVAVGVHWNRHIEHLIKEFMNDPYIVIMAMEEAALYGCVQQVVHLCLEGEKTSTLLQTLDFTPSQAEKTLIFTCSVAETETVCKVVESNSIFCLKMHKEMIFNLKSVLEQWEKKLSSGSHIVLALTDDCIPLLAITDATCVIHFSFPSSPKIFGGRLYCMSDHFQSLTEQYGVKPCSLGETSVWFAFSKVQVLEMSQKEDTWALDNVLVKFIDEGRTGLVTRDQLLHLPERFHTLPPQAVEFIVCRVKPVDNEIEWNPKVGNSTGVGKMGKERERVQKSFQRKGRFLWVLQNRVQVLEMSQKEDTWALDNVLVKFIDEGRTGLVTRDQLLHLPERFHTLPPQAVEFIVCRVKPVDNEIEWNPKVHITKLSNLKTSVIDYNVRAEILSMGMGIDNSEHVEQLKKLYKGAKMPSSEESLNQTLIPSSREDSACLPSTWQEDKGSEKGTDSKTDSENRKHETLPENTGGASINKTTEPPKSFHPQIKWFQKEDVVILKIKIRNVKDYKCKYFRDRVVFSAWVGEKFYLADLELQANIIKDDCKCIIKYDEPVITLAKEQKESWCGLLKQRNPNVAFDFDHWEDCDEDKEDSHFAKVVNSKNLSCSVAGLVETSDKSSDEDESDSE
ncbi:hypothetical protein Celaphus_00004332 [Cervus elaphus hippelaphus]|uniref:RNA helicase n=1 Tax=Cervus elaphus hippelaphus TaxID=46360 RepID=A0A212DC84_CEREH|nr:hypothetical protein Celaphus_00004332 [Cervus elaphus hippelaphus]